MLFLKKQIFIVPQAPFKKVGIMKYGIILIYMLCFFLPEQFVHADQEPDKWKTHREDVRIIQKFLKRQDYHPGDSDGRIGPKTKAAIRAYQTDKQLPPDGKISEVLLNHILSHVRIPDDFQLNYSRYSYSLKGTELTINANGQYLVTTNTPDSLNPSTRILAKGCLSSARMKMMYIQILSCGVFNKQHPQKDTETVGGGQGYPHPLNDADRIIIEIKANGKSGNPNTREYCLKEILKIAGPTIKKHIR